MLLGTEITSWSNVWAAAVAVQEMCVKQGKIGASKINGLSRFTDSLAFCTPRTELPWFSLHTADIGVSLGEKKKKFTRSPES